MNEKNKMNVLAFPINKPFEVSPQKAELFEKNTKTKNGKKLLFERINKINNENIKWEK